MLADDASNRDLPIWLLGGDSHVLDHPGPLPHELTDRLRPHAAGARVAAVDIDELGPEVTAARIELATAAGTEHVTASLNDTARSWPSPRPRRSGSPTRSWTG